MRLIKFIIWLTTGAVIGWFAHQIITAEHKRWPDKPTPSEEDSSIDY